MLLFNTYGGMQFPEMGPRWFASTEKEEGKLGKTVGGRKHSADIAITSVATESCGPPHDSSLMDVTVVAPRVRQPRDRPRRRPRRRRRRWACRWNTKFDERRGGGKLLPREGRPQRRAQKTRRRESKTRLSRPTRGPARRPSATSKWRLRFAASRAAPLLAEASTRGSARRRSTTAT
jgi:hypothetical protein